MHEGEVSQWRLAKTLPKLKKDAVGNVKHATVRRAIGHPMGHGFPRPKGGIRGCALGLRETPILLNASCSSSFKNLPKTPFWI